MLQKIGSSAFLVGALLTAMMPAAGVARDHGGNSGRGHGGSLERSERSNSRSNSRSKNSQRFSPGSRNYARGLSGGNRYLGGQSFASPRGYDGRRGYPGGRSSYGYGYAVPRSYGRRVYPGNYGGGLYLGYSAPYGYPISPSYAYAPGYAYDSRSSYGPAAAPQVCADGSYDRDGRWVPDPNCYRDEQQYTAPRNNYNSNPQQFRQPQRNYDPDQQQYPQPEQNYDPNETRR